jgi:hypothetical protein
MRLQVLVVCLQLSVILNQVPPLTILPQSGQPAAAAADGPLSPWPPQQPSPQSPSGAGESKAAKG